MVTLPPHLTASVESTPHYPEKDQAVVDVWMDDDDIARVFAHVNSSTAIVRVVLSCV